MRQPHWTEMNARQADAHSSAAVAHAVTAAGMLHTFVLAALAAVAFGCSRSSVSELHFRSVQHHAIPAEDRRIPAPRGVAVNQQHELYVLDTAARILVLDSEGNTLRQWHMPDSDVGTPEDLTVMSNGLIAVPDTHYHRIVFFDRIGTVKRTLGRHGTDLGEFIYPVSLVEDDTGNFFVCEYGSNDRVQKFSPDGKPLLAFGGFGTAPGHFQRPSGMVWRDGHLYVADAANQRVQVFTGNGDYVGILGGTDRQPELLFPYDIALGPDASLYVVEWGAGRVTRLGLDGRVIGRVGTPGDGVMQFTTPWGIASDPAGCLYVADTGNRRIVRLTP